MRITIRVVHEELNMPEFIIQVNVYTIQEKPQRI